MLKTVFFFSANELQNIQKFTIVLKTKIYLFYNTKILVNSKLGWLATHSKILIYIMFGYNLVIENYSEN